jgi:predicted RNA-binding Zn-ribbon protein involved in translation (DUF1610 family)
VRTLLAHLVYALVLLSLAVALPAAAVDRLPLPIGSLSDYGAVLDRHGRDQVNSLIDQTVSRTGIEVNILATWENPLPDARSLAQALLTAWNLSSRNALLAVYVRTDADWTMSIVATDRLRQNHGDIDRELEAATSDLVAHDRIKEAMLALFDDLLSGAPRSETTDASKSAGFPISLSVALVVLAAIAGAFWIHRYICPRCGSILRRSEGPATPLNRRSRRVYSCRRCGFRRER